MRRLCWLHGSTALDYGKLTKALQRYDGASRRVVATPAGSALKGTLKECARRAESAWKLLEIALKAHYGILKGGGVLRTVRLAAGLGADDAVAAQRIVTRMMFDPEFAAHLLTRKVQDVGSPAWNEKLAKLLRRVQVGREVFGNEDG